MLARTKPLRQSEDCNTVCTWLMRTSPFAGEPLKFFHWLERVIDRRIQKALAERELP